MAVGIRDFGSRATEDIYHGKNSKRARTVPVELHDRARRKLDQINRVENLEDLDHPPANRLEALKGDLKGKHSIRINQQFRIIFVWAADGIHEVEIVDYHK